MFWDSRPALAAPVAAKTPQVHAGDVHVPHSVEARVTEGQHDPGRRPPDLDCDNDPLPGIRARERPHLDAGARLTAPTLRRAARKVYEGVGPPQKARASEPPGATVAVVDGWWSAGVEDREPGAEPNASG